MRYLPLTEEEKNKILSLCKVERFEDLLDSVPEAARLKGKLKTGEGLSEDELLERFEGWAAKIRAAGMSSYLGQGAYDHNWPRVIDQLINRGEFLTAYTPYQPEISQGTLQSIFEFQSLIAESMGMEISNASLYDGSTAMLEAILMAARLGRKESGRVLVSEGTYPETLQLLKTYLEPLNIQIEIWKADPNTYTSTAKSLEKSGEAPIACVLQSPNKWGLIEDWAELKKASTETQSKSVAVTFQMHSLTEFSAPGEHDIDIACGEGQAFGIPVGFGGPYVGLLCCRKSDVRQMPGRLVGVTEDAKGERAFCITLSTREQHIRREKATSNICSNQNLMALRSAMYLTLMGPQGLLELSQTLRSKTEFLATKLKASLKKAKVVEGDRLNELSVAVGDLSAASLEKILNDSYSENIICGAFNEAPIKQASKAKTLTIAVTERHSREELERLANFLGKHF
jgi:glycine dehydrogenase subunit 1